MVRRRRQDVRYAIQFPVQLTHAAVSQSLLTDDVSRGGLFLCTKALPPLMQLVQVQFSLPLGGRLLKAHGMTVHAVSAGSGHDRLPGIGIQFYALDRSTREAWETFTRQVAESSPRSADQTPLRLRRGTTTEPRSQRFGHHEAVLDLRPPTLERLEEIYSRDLATKTLFVPTTQALKVGDHVVVTITHPTSGEPLLCEATVLLRTLSPEGLAVEVHGVDQRFREDFLEFLRGPADSGVFAEA